jgi:bud emergence protein 1
VSHSTCLLCPILHTRSHTSSRISRISLASPTGSLSTQFSPSSARRTQAFYAQVLHDFVAERPDELDAKAGDSISVVAQSNREWFVAKSIGRLGKPGLIPVSFVEVRDPATGAPIPDVGALMDNGTLPRVEDWKKQMLSYKANSIALGVLDELTQPPATGIATTNPPSANPAASAQASSTRTYEDQRQSPDRPQTPPILPDGLLLSASVVSFHFEIDEYWFRLHALYQPFDPSGSSELPPALSLVLYRAYNDFFDYQTALLQTFPREAGREGNHPRIIPFMPGPADDVDDALTATRQAELDDYLHRLCRLNRTTARYILQHHLTREFLSLKPGDFEKDVEPQSNYMAEVGWYDPSEDPEPVSMMDPPSPLDDVVRKLQQTSINSTAAPHSDSDGSDYGDDVDSAAYSSKSAGYPQRQQLHSSSHSKSKLHSTGQVPRSSARNGNGHSATATDGVFRDSAYSRSSASSSSRWAESSPMRSSGAASIRSDGALAGNAGGPKISAGNPQTAYIKIKIFDRIQDELIAIRVHPRVTHEQLLDKVQQRLGGKVARLSYREDGEGGEDYVPLQQDDDVLWWIGSTDKHFLYAD